MYSLTLLKVGDTFLDKENNAYSVLAKTVGEKKPFEGMDIITIQPLFSVMQEGVLMLAKPIALTAEELLYHLGVVDVQPNYGEPPVLN